MVSKQNKKLGKDDLDFIFGEVGEDQTNIHIDFKLNRLELGEEKWEQGDDKLEGDAIVDIFYDATIKVRHMFIEEMEESIELKNVKGPIIAKYSLEGEKPNSVINYEVIGLGIKFEETAANITAGISFQRGKTNI